jgi:hypothetical protein
MKVDEKPGRSSESYSAAYRQSKSFCWSRICPSSDSPNLMEPENATILASFGTVELGLLAGNPFTRDAFNDATILVAVDGCLFVWINNNLFKYGKGVD